MAQVVTRSFIDDIDGTEAERTFTFAVDGTNYEIDLSRSNIEEFKAAIGGFLESARKTRGTSRKSTSANALRQSREHNQAIRDWAKANGLSVSDRGRISSEIQEKFDAAHAPQSTSAPALA